ncbi:MAG: 50S ribosomal protein L25/general stress protein Ctc [Desulfobacterales bacterium]
MKIIELKANIRTEVGNGPSRALRRKNRIPAILYGANTEPILLSLDTSDLEQALKKGNSRQILLNLVIQNGKTINRSAMIKELQIHPVFQTFLHVDFYEIAMDRKIKVKVPVVTVGKSKGVELGGTLQLIRREVDVLCLPLKIPNRFEVDITDLDIGDSIHVKEIPLEGDIELSTDVNFTVVTVLAPKVEEVEKVEEEELEEAAGEGEESEQETEDQ